MNKLIDALLTAARVSAIVTPFGSRRDAVQPPLFCTSRDIGRFGPLVLVVPLSVLVFA